VARRGEIEDYLFASLIPWILTALKSLMIALVTQLGDQMLIVIADRLKIRLRYKRYCSAVWGDEFTVLLDDIRVRKLRALPERITEVAHPLT